MVAEPATKSQPERKMSASARIKILLIKRGMTARELASRLGLSKAYTYQLVSGACTTKAGRQRISNYFSEEFWPGVLPAVRASDRDGLRSVEQEQTSAVNPGDHDKNLRTGANGPEPPADEGNQSLQSFRSV
jgi:transcriptional regulator with XRE-family HTH domain